MQEVYEDGTGGKVQPFDLQKAMDALQNPMVDHVEVFNLGSGAHKRAVGRINDVVASRREKKRLKKILNQSIEKSKK